jgi:hypothetical protein
MFAAGLAMIAPIAIMAGVSIANGASKAKAERENETIEKNQEKIDDLKELDEQHEELQTLIKDYKELAAAEKDTLEAQKAIAEQLPDLIKKYKGLEVKHDIDLGADELQRELDTYDITGKLNVEKTENLLKQAEKTSAETRMQAAQENILLQKNHALATQSGSNDGRITNGRYYVDIGGSKTRDTEAESLLEQYDFFSGGRINADVSTPEALIKTYKEMVKARNDML